MKRYAVIGKPINHSLSPILHKYFYKKLSIDATFDSIEINNENELKSFANKNIYDGFNVTIPYKQKILEYNYKINPRVLEIGSANTVMYINKTAIINNTDWYGFILALNKNKININNKEVIIIGMGGAGKAVYYAINTMRPSRIKLFNRSQFKIKKLNSNNCFIYSFCELDNHIKDDSIIINCTSIGLDTFQTPFSLDLISKNQIIIDVIYRVNKTELINQAIIKGAKVMDGMDMFIYQGLLSHEIWFGNNIIQKFNIDQIRKYLELNIC